MDKLNNQFTKKCKYFIFKIFFNLIYLSLHWVLVVVHGIFIAVLRVLSSYGEGLRAHRLSSCSTGVL